jgi:short subunit dehydrogenase-like uncharacterized protein
MPYKILLYGANGFSGRIVAEVAAQRPNWAGGEFELVLAGRSRDELARLGRRLGMPVLAFALDDHRALDDALGCGVFAVINAAGPFASTAIPLVKAALRNHVHYVDINGEADVYKQLDDFAFIARQRDIAIVGGAGHSATTSDVMLRAALKHLSGQGIGKIGTVRIAFSHVKYVSRGSAQTAWRSIREQTMVVRTDPAAKGEAPAQLVIDYEPSGKIERIFDFGDVETQGDRADGGGPRTARRIAMLANLLDLLTARITLTRHVQMQARRIESFIEMPEGARIFVQMGALSAPLYALPAWRQFVRTQVDLLPEGPDAWERRHDRHTILLQIDDGAGRTLIDWRMETPDPYDFTAECVLGVVEGLATLKTKPDAGLRTPGEMFAIDSPARGLSSSLFANCRFEPRTTMTAR